MKNAGRSRFEQKAGAFWQFHDGLVLSVTGIWCVLRNFVSFACQEGIVLAGSQELDSGKIIPDRPDAFATDSVFEHKRISKRNGFLKRLRSL